MTEQCLIPFATQQITQSMTAYSRTLTIFRHGLLAANNIITTLKTRQWSKVRRAD